VLGFLFFVFGLGMIGVTMVIAQAVEGGEALVFRWVPSVGIGILLYAIGEYLEKKSRKG